MMYGASGAGKSHIIASLAYKIAKKGLNLLYIPDCAILLKNPPRYLREALLNAYHQHEVFWLYQGLLGATKLAELRLYTWRLPPKSLFAIIDPKHARHR